MIEKVKPLITVLGVLGKQGQSVAQTLIKSGLYRVRGITRRIDSPEAVILTDLGVELINLPLALGHKKEFVKAFSGSMGVFIMTPNITPPATHEMELGKVFADAAVEAGVKHIIFSSLANVSKITSGKKFAPHFTDKANVELYIRILPITSTFIHLAFFYSNLIEFYPPTVNGDTLVFPIYLPEDFRAPFVDPLTATGPAVLEIFANPKLYAGMSLPIIGDIISPKEMLETFTRVTGKKSQYSDAFTREGLEHHFPALCDNKVLVDEIIGMVEYAVEYGYYTKGLDLQWSRNINPNSLTWEQYLKNNKWFGN